MRKEEIMTVMIYDQSCAESFAASDFTAAMDANAVIDLLLEKLETAPVL